MASLPASRKTDFYIQKINLYPIEADSHKTALASRRSACEEGHRHLLVPSMDIKKKLVGTINVNIEAVLDSDGKPTAKAVITASGAGVTVSGSADIGFTVAVKNNPIDPLPDTGGMGTTVFYVLGGLMVAAALVLLTSKKRMAA